MIFFGWRTHLLRLNRTEVHNCQICGQQRPFYLMLRYNRWHLYWLFGMVVSKQYMMLCDVCGQGWKLEAQAEERFFSKSPIPFMHRFGLLSLATTTLLMGAVISLLRQ